jgi:hypothetical protein
MKFFLPIFMLLIIFSCAPKKTALYSTIEYNAGACFGFCPIFNLKINSDRSAVIKAERFTFNDGKSKDDFSKPKEGTFTTTIKEEDYTKLIQRLDGLKFDTLQDNYKNKKITDLPTSILTINFTNGNVKKIQDYGKNGTPELRKVYEFLENLRKSQSWKKIAD